jgi:methyl-accepting chemotaxis protein
MPIILGGIMGSALSFLLMLAVVFIITGRIVDPIKSLSQKLSRVAAGDMSFSLATNSRDEVGDLSRDITQVVDIFNRISGEISVLSTEFNEKGDIDYRIDSSKYSGDHKKMVDGINQFTENYGGEVLQILGILREIENGNFHLKVDKFPGKKVVLNQTFDSLVNNLNNISFDIKNLAENASDGNLSVRAESAKFQGDWAVLMNELNELVGAVSAPLEEIETVLLEMSKGNFTHMSGNYKGKFDTVKQAVNKTEQTTVTYINEITQILDSISDGDLALSITHDYIGSYAPVKQALDKILKSLNSTMREITSAANRLLDDANQISQSSMHLANGSTKQAGAILELGGAIQQINEKTQANTENAVNANEFARKTTQHAQTGNDEMRQMVVSMDGIKESSANISKIIKTIDDIAFQTNLLALNAAVEAARAGEHGKGFSVVAEEVRSLAGRSKSAASETTSLIDDSINTVNDGMKAAHETASSLETIVNDIMAVSDLISKIAAISQEQSLAITQINNGVNEISQVVHDNSAVSQECATISQELNSQAELLKQLVSFFKLKG